MKSISYDNLRTKTHFSKIWSLKFRKIWTYVLKLFPMTRCRGYYQELSMTVSCALENVVSTISCGNVRLTTYKHLETNNIHYAPGDITAAMLHMRKLGIGKRKQVLQSWVHLSHRVVIIFTNLWHAPNGANTAAMLLLERSQLQCLR